MRIKTNKERQPKEGKLDATNMVDRHKQHSLDVAHSDSLAIPLKPTWSASVPIGDGRSRSTSIVSKKNEERERERSQLMTGNNGGRSIAITKETAKRG